MSSSNEAPLSPRYQLAMSCFEELLDYAAADVASEFHRIARLRLDRSIDAEEEFRSFDVFCQTHPAIAADVVNCMNCGRPIVADRFAPHLEKCMGKGLKARTKTTRSCIAGCTRSNNNGSAAAAASSYSRYPNTANTNRGSTPNGVTDGGGSAGRDHRNGVCVEGVITALQ